MIKLILFTSFCLNLFAASKVDNEIVKRFDVLLNKNDVYRAKFIQKDKEVVHHGDFILDKKNQELRIEYKTQPIKITLMPKEVLIEDMELKEINKLPTRKTPLAVILKDDINLQRDARIFSTWVENGVEYIKIQDKKYREYGIVDLGMKNGKLVHMNVRDYSNNLLSNLEIK